MSEISCETTDDPAPLTPDNSKPPDPNYLRFDAPVGARILAFMRRNNLTRVKAVFDGCGDSGQVEDLFLEREDLILYDSEAESIKDQPFDEQECRINGGTYDGVARKWIYPRGRSFEDAVEQFVYDELPEDWGENSGCYGYFEFNAVENKIIQSREDRIQSTEHSEKIYKF